MFSPLTPPADLPLWLSILLAVLLIGGGLFAFIGALGLVCFRNFYDRLHFPGLTSTLAAGAILAACIVYSSYCAGALILGDALILFFINLAATISLMMLTRAAAMRDFSKRWRDHSANILTELAHEPPAEAKSNMPDSASEAAAKQSENIPRPKQEKQPVQAEGGGRPA